ncbi:MAG: hypothetical protein U5N85_16515 [Arcicella sp.]|nr:hypothetical protein [Arcicella sp.]
MQNNIIVRLSKTQLAEIDFWKHGLQTITEAAQEGLNINRVSVWQYF